MRKLQIKKLSSAAVLTIAIVGIAFVGVLANVKPAAAYSGRENIVFGNWHCPSGGTVVFVNGAHDYPTGDAVAGVYGNKVSLLASINTYNSVAATVTCKVHPPSMWWCPWCTVNMPVEIPGMGFWPSYAGQTFYL